MTTTPHDAAPPATATASASAPEETNRPSPKPKQRKTTAKVATRALASSDVLAGPLPPPVAARKKEEEKGDEAGTTTDEPQLQRSDDKVGKDGPKKKNKKKKKEAKTKEGEKKEEEEETPATSPTKKKNKKQGVVAPSTSDFDGAVGKIGNDAGDEEGPSSGGADPTDANQSREPPGAATTRSDSNMPAPSPSSDPRQDGEEEADGDSEHDEPAGTTVGDDSVGGVSARGGDGDDVVEAENGQAGGAIDVPPMVESGSESGSVHSDEEAMTIPLSSRAAKLPSRSAGATSRGAQGRDAPRAADPIKEATPDADPRVPAEASAESNENWTIGLLHAGLVLVVLMTAAGVGVGAYYYVSSLQQAQASPAPSNGEADSGEFLINARKVLEGIGARLETALASMDDLQTSLVAQARAVNYTWPFASFSHFASEATRARYRAGGAPYLALHPVVTADQRTQWESYASATSETWILQSLTVQATDELYEGPSLFDGYVLDVVHDSYYQPVPRDHEVVFPTWQSSPVVARFPCYNWDLFSLEKNGAVNRTFRSARPVLGEPYSIPDPTDNELDVVEAQWWSERFRDYVPFSRDPYEPLSNLYYPVVDWDQAGLRTPQIFGTVTNSSVPIRGEPRLVGVLMMILYWSDLLKESTLSLGSDEMDVVVSNPCSTPFTYRLRPQQGGVAFSSKDDGDTNTAVFMGKGNLHDDPDVEPLEGYTLSLPSLTENYTSRETSFYAGLPLDREYCPFTLTAYPVPRNVTAASGSESTAAVNGSDSSAAAHAGATSTASVSANPVAAAMVAALVVVWTSLVFVVHGACVRAYGPRRRPFPSAVDDKARAGAGRTTNAAAAAAASAAEPAADAPPSPTTKE